MADEKEKAHRVLFIKIRTPSPDATALLATMMKGALPLYQSFGDAKVRMLRNVDDQTQFLQVIEYQTDKAIELNRHQLASDPLVQKYLQGWRALFPGAVEMDVYEDLIDA
jgi:hypothetical protein